MPRKRDVAFLVVVSAAAGSISSDFRRGPTANLFATDIRTSTIVVSASNSKNSLESDFQCPPPPADSAPQVAAAIKALATVGGAGTNTGRIVFLDGDYQFNSTVDIRLDNPGGTPPANEVWGFAGELTLEGQSVPADLDFSNSAPAGLRLGSTVFSLGADVPMFKFHAPDDPGGKPPKDLHNRINRVALKGLTFLGGRRDAKVLHFINCAKVEIDDCGFVECAPAIYNEDGWDFQTTRCGFGDCGDSTTTNGQFHRAAVVGIGTSPDRPGVAYWRISECTWQNRLGPGIFSSRLNVSQQQLPPGSIYLVNSKFEDFGVGADAWPCFVGEVSHGRIAGNRFFFAKNVGGSSPELGTLVYLNSGSRFCQIQDNQFLEPGDDSTPTTPATVTTHPALSIGGSDHVITGNFFKTKYPATAVVPFIELRSSASGAVVFNNMATDNDGVGTRRYRNLITQLPNGAGQDMTILDLQAEDAIVSSGPELLLDGWLAVRLRASGGDKRFIPLYK